MKSEVETEGRGIDYERFALGWLFGRLVRERSITNVCEIPAGGEKAMPSLYSLAFAAAGCRVTLVNPVEASLDAWRTLGLAPEVVHCTLPAASGLPADHFDLVWNFVSLSQQQDDRALLDEMIRLSRRHVMFVGVNRFNPGFLSHRLVHRLADVPWTHGRLAYMNLFRVRRIFASAGLGEVEAGGVDAPPYPDSLGLRDMRLHRKPIDLHRLRWRSRTIVWMQRGYVPLGIRLMHLLERIPKPLPLTLLVSHLFYLLAEKSRPAAG